MVRYVFYKKLYVLNDSNPFGYDLISIAKVKEIESKTLSVPVLEKMASKLEKELMGTIDTSTHYVEVNVTESATWTKFSTDPFWERYFVDAGTVPNKYKEDGVTINPEYVNFLEAQVRGV